MPPEPEVYHDAAENRSVLEALTATKVYVKTDELSCPHVRAKDARPTNDGWRRQVLVGTFGTCSGLTLYSCRPFTFHESTPALAVYFRTDCVVEGSSGTSF